MERVYRSPRTPISRREPPKLEAESLASETMEKEKEERFMLDVGVTVITLHTALCIIVFLIKTYW